MRKRVAVIGAGVGGLSVAARLARRGYHVDIYERLAQSGGRCNIIVDRGFRFDTGPSFVLMPDFFRDVFEDCGQRMEKYLDLRMLDVSYKIFFSDGDVLTIDRDSQKTKANLERIEQGAAAGFDRFLAQTKQIYELTRPLMFKCFQPSALVNPSYAVLAGRIKAFETYWALAKRFFKSEKLCYAFTFEAMFLGVSPFEAPAFYSVVTYVDHAQKIFHPMGGMYQIPMALEKMARLFGAKFHFDCEITSLESRDGQFRLSGRNGEFDADRVVVNADYAYAQQDLLKRRLPDYRYSCSVYLLYLGLKKKVKGFEHHNLFFSRDLRHNLKQIFSAAEIPDDPSFYVHVPTVTDSSLAPPQKDLFYILVPVPNLEKRILDTPGFEQQIKTKVYAKIDAILGEPLERLIEVERAFYPRDFSTRYNIKNGATFGLSHTFWQSAFFRPPNIDRRWPGLYYTGASSQPGGGLPPVIAGSRIVSDLISGQDLC